MMLSVDHRLGLSEDELAQAIREEMEHICRLILNKQSSPKSIESCISQINKLLGLYAQTEGKMINTYAGKDESAKLAIAVEAFFTFPGTGVSVCLLTLKDGSYVIGSSIPHQPENEEHGYLLAKHNAVHNAILERWAEGE